MLAEEEKIPFTSHLEELRSRLIKCFIAVVDGFVAAGFGQGIVDNRDGHGFAGFPGQEGDGLGEVVGVIAAGGRRAAGVDVDGYAGSGGNARAAGQREHHAGADIFGVRIGRCLRKFDKRIGIGQRKSVESANESGTGCDPNRGCRDIVSPGCAVGGGRNTGVAADDGGR